MSPPEPRLLKWSALPPPTGAATIWPLMTSQWAGRNGTLDKESNFAKTSIICLVTILAHPNNRFWMEPLSKPSRGQNSQRRLYSSARLLKPSRSGWASLELLDDSSSGLARSVLGPGIQRRYDAQKFFAVCSSGDAWASVSSGYRCAPQAGFALERRDGEFC